LLINTILPELHLVGLLYTYKYFTVVPLFPLSVIQAWTEITCPYLLPTGSIGTVADAVDIMEMDRKILAIHSQRLPSHQLALPAAPRASSLVPNIRMHKHC